MTTPKTALLLVGSAKPAGQSTSEALGAALLGRLSGYGITSETRFAARAMRTEDRTQELLEAAERADLLVLTFPLYVDSLPYLATQALERIAAQRQAQTQPKAASFLAIANCGFPEAHHCAPALAICQEFARAAGFRWAGGLGLGAGGAISGQPLDRLGGMAHNPAAALDLAAAALAAGEAIPEAAAAKMAQPMMPAGMYLLIGDLGWVIQARRNRTLRRLGARPFKPAQ